MFEVPSVTCAMEFAALNLNSACLLRLVTWLRPPSGLKQPTTFERKQAMPVMPDAFARSAVSDGQQYV